MIARKVWGTDFLARKWTRGEAIALPETPVVLITLPWWPEGLEARFALAPRPRWIQAGVCLKPTKMTMIMMMLLVLVLIML